MQVVARILGVSLLTSALVTAIGLALIRAAAGAATPSSQYGFPAFILACLGGVIGVVAGAAGEIVSAQRSKPSDWPQ
jgi:hypothetical protein